MDKIEIKIKHRAKEILREYAPFAEAAMESGLLTAEEVGTLLSEMIVDSMELE